MPPRDEPGSEFWRAFPWNPFASSGAAFSARSVPPIERQTQGRFDLGACGGPQILYLAEAPEHAVAERLRPFTGRALKAAMLRASGHDLALVRVVVPGGVAARLTNLTDPQTLLSHGIRPDALASNRRARTQAISHELYEAGSPGFRWWSALGGDWHTVVLYLDRVPLDSLGIAIPTVLTVDHPAVRDAARELRMVG